MHSLIRKALWGGIALLYVLSIPWYRDPGAVPEIWWGFPDWAATALACYVGVAVLNSAAWRLTDLVDEAPREPARPGSDPQERA